MSNKPEIFVPYHPMPLRYLSIWVALIGMVMVFYEIRDYGWPPGSYIEFVGSVVIGGLAGGWFWGSVCWKAGLYKKFPPRTP